MSKAPVLFGVPFDAGCRSSTAQTVDSRHAPREIRAKLDKILKNFNLTLPFTDIGDVEAKNSVDSVLMAVQEKVSQLAQDNQRFCVLGGAHTLTLGSLRGLKQAEKDISLIYFDAHPDLMPRDEIDYGSTLFHAIEEGILDPKRIAFIGVRQIEEDEHRIIKEKEILSISPLELEKLGRDTILDRIKARCPAPFYMSIDLDSLDPCFAPGVSTPYPLGMRPRELLGLASEFFTEDLIGFELVELAPQLDRHEETAHLAVAMLLELHQIWNNNVTV